MDDRHGARQAHRFDPARAALLDDPARVAYLPPERIVELLDAPPNATVVDFGTGTGFYAIALKRLRPDLRVIALDEQPEMLALVRAKPDAAGLEIVDAAGIASWRRAVDRVLAINVLHELGDAALSSLVELLADGGKALFIDWDGSRERDAGPPAGRVYTPVEAEDRLRRLGLVVELSELLPYHYALRCVRI